ncbi:FtsX-like permease family protein [Geobacter sp. FeAm09]|uniref:ABC transporter permease n=1 Tax=Geobacter sp. FeAm09 TaxID=2597769 RepID=UPI0011EF3AE5|nr:FtsX-like permease family protein [Geobacter sp. FeAm09]QEM68273.1 FtsX-like permease family protein [Geobacter sp. FeAm09]
MPTSLNRHRNIIDFALSSLLRRRMKNLSLMAVYTLVVFVIASLLFFVHAVKREAALVLADAPDMVVQRLMAGRHDLIPAAYTEKIRAIPGVSTVTPRLWGYYYDPVFGANYTIMVPPQPAVEPGSILVGAEVSRSQRVKVGDMVALRTSTHIPLLLTVKGVYPAASNLVAADLIVMSPEDFQAMFNLPTAQATDLAVTVANPRELATIAAKVLDAFPDTRPILKSEMLRTYDAIFDWRGGMMVVILAAAVLSFVIFAWDKATGLSAEERREIGILKSIGWETADVLYLKFWEGIVVSLSAFLLGTLLAYGHVFFFSASLFEHALKGWAVLYPKFRLVPAVDGYHVAVLFFLTVLPYTVATIVPAWLAAATDPDAAMRS